MHFPSTVAGFIALSVLAHPASAQGAAGTPSPIGVWRGTSTCQVRPSACNDEIVVYRVTPLNAPDSISMDARKIVNGQEEEMGVFACRLASPATTFTCTMPKGVWRFTLRGDSLVGELRLSDSTRYRDIRAARSH